MEMVQYYAKYAFWIVICIPIVFAGIAFACRLFKDNLVMNREIDEKKKAKMMARDERKQFDDAYAKRRSGER